jgi:hypothetical protein
MQKAASKWMYVGKILASWRRMVSLEVHVAHADNVLLRFFAAADDAETASSLAGMPFPDTAFFTRAMLYVRQA